MTVYIPTGEEESLPFIWVCAGCHRRQLCQNITQHGVDTASCQDCGVTQKVYKCTGFKVGIT